MSTNTRLTEVLESALEVPFDDSSKFILFSDCHRGDNSWADDFAHNQTLFFYALEHYNDAGFTYIEVGDGDELWENKNFEDIRKAHSHVFWLMREFHKDQRLYLLWGNHNIEQRKPDALSRYRNDRTDEDKPLFDGITVHEGLVLRHSDTSNRILVAHGHQGDLMNDRLWRLSKFLVMHFWRHLQLIGINDPTSPAQDSNKRGKVEARIKQWIRANNNQMTICGHTHRPAFPDEGYLPYFNVGSCVHPRCITGIEIQGGEIALIKWWVRPKSGGALHVVKDPIVGPEKLRSFWRG